MSLEEYTNAVKRQFLNGSKRSKEAVDSYFNEKETKDYIKECFSFLGKDSTGTSDPKAVASCLDMMY